MKSIGKLALVALLAGVVLSAIAIVWANARTEAMLDAPVGTKAGDRLTIPRGTSYSALLDRLQARGVIEHPLLLRVRARLEPARASIKAGEYRVQPDMTVRELLRAIRDGDVIRHELTLVEGWNFREMMAAVQASDALEHTLADAEAKTVMSALGHPDEHPEGRFLPETYHFTAGMTDVDFLRRAYRAMEDALARVWADRDENLPIDSAYEALILASIIEKETAVPAERERIAGVFVRRLRLGMRLQTDPTVIYGLGEDFDGDIRYRDLRTDTPYNTYTRSGLPPTPIAMPGIDSLRAAVSPAEGDSLYFVARGDGTHVFSSTLEEHNAAVREYQLGQD